MPSFWFLDDNSFEQLTRCCHDLTANQLNYHVTLSKIDRSQPIKHSLVQKALNTDRTCQSPTLQYIKTERRKRAQEALHTAQTALDTSAQAEASAETSVTAAENDLQEARKEADAAAQAKADAEYFSKSNQQNQQALTVGRARAKQRRANAELRVRAAQRTLSMHKSAKAVAAAALAETQIEYDAAVREEQKVLDSVERRLSLLVKLGLRFQDTSKESEFKSLLFRKMCDCCSVETWSSDDEKRFRQLFVLDLAGEDCTRSAPHIVV